MLMRKWSETHVANSNKADITGLTVATIDRLWAMMVCCHLHIVPCTREYCSSLPTHRSTISQLHYTFHNFNSNDSPCNHRFGDIQTVVLTMLSRLETGRSVHRQLNEIMGRSDGDRRGGCRNLKYYIVGSWEGSFSSDSLVILINNVKRICKILGYYRRAGPRLAIWRDSSVCHGQWAHSASAAFHLPDSGYLIWDAREPLLCWIVQPVT